MAEFLVSINDNLAPLIILLVGAVASPFVLMMLRRAENSLRGDIDLYLGALVVLLGACALSPWLSWLIGDRLALFAWKHISVSGSLFALTLWFMFLNPSSERKSRRQHQHD